MANISGCASRRNFSITLNSSGTVFDGGWERWWAAQSKLDSTDWVTLLDAADGVLRQLRARRLSS
jgi:hypothetical protein